jgi:hypothetical protein
MLGEVLIIDISSCYAINQRTGTMRILNENGLSKNKNNLQIKKKYKFGRHIS